MNIGIIGAEEKKFTELTKHATTLKIEHIINQYPADDKPTIVSGHCHLGGVDIWAEEIAKDRGIPTLIFPPKIHAWEGGYKQRNIQIAEASDVIYVIVVSELPPGIPPDPWNKNGCYHCANRWKTGKLQSGFQKKHVKSGACWTAWYAIETLGKEAHWIVI